MDNDRLSDRINLEPKFVLGLPEDAEEDDEDLPEELNKTKKKTKNLSSILAKLIRSKSLLITDSLLFPHIQMNTAYLMNEGDYDEIVNRNKVARSVLVSTLDELTFPLYVFDFKKKLLRIYSLSDFVAKGKPPNSPSDASIILYHFAKARLDKDYLRDIERLYV